MKKATSVGCEAQHLFCLQCITMWLGTEDKPCPLCNKEKLKASGLVPCPARDRLIENLEVSCKLSAMIARTEGRGCDWIGALSDLCDHLSKRCRLSSVKCPHCSSSMKKFEMETHLETCPDRKVPCNLCS